MNGVASTTTYLYGLNGLIATTDGSGSRRYYLQDGLGSTTQLTDTGGSVTDGYTYDVFGATTHTGTGAQPFTYTGQQQDASANRGLVYLRARMYDPALGRFLTKDPLRLSSSTGMRNKTQRISSILSACVAGATLGIVQHAQRRERARQPCAVGRTSTTNSQTRPCGSHWQVRA